MKLYALFALFLVQIAPAVDPLNWVETDWTKKIAAEIGGDDSVRLWDGTKPDIVTEGVAWEVEWIDKHYQALSQSITYAQKTGRRPGIIFLIRGKAASVKWFSRDAMIPVAWVRGLGGQVEVRFYDVESESFYP